MPTIKVYASIDPEQLIKGGEAAGLPPIAVDYLRHCEEVELELHVDGENGAVVDCIVTSKF